MIDQVKNYLLNLLPAFTAVELGPLLLDHCVGLRIAKSAVVARAAGGIDFSEPRIRLNDGRPTASNKVRKGPTGADSREGRQIGELKVGGNDSVAEPLPLGLNQLSEGLGEGGRRGGELELQRVCAGEARGT